MFQRKKINHSQRTRWHKAPNQQKGGHCANSYKTLHPTLHISDTPNLPYTLPRVKEFLLTPSVLIANSGSSLFITLIDRFFSCIIAVG